MERSNPAKPRRSVNRCYRILGLPPGAALADVKKAYLDLAQVWHPDRFVHDARLQQKVQENLKCINEAYEILQSSDLPDKPTRISHISSSFHAILGIGDMLKTGTHRRPIPKRREFRVLLLDEDYTRPTRRSSSNRLWLALGGLVVLGIALVVLAGAIWTATRLARSPAVESTAVAPVQPPPSALSREVGAGQTPLAPPQLDSLSYSLQVAAFNTLDRALEYAVSLENRRLVAAVTPIRVRGSIWYRVILGALPTAAEAEAALVGLWRDGLVESGEGAILRTPQAFDLGVRESDAAWEETQMLRERGIPAYSVEASLGTARIFVGAFETPDQAAVVESLLTAAGLTATLMTRTGSAR